MKKLFFSITIIMVISLVLGFTSLSYSYKDDVEIDYIAKSDSKSEVTYEYVTVDKKELKKLKKKDKFTKGDKAIIKKLITETEQLIAKYNELTTNYNAVVSYINDIEGERSKYVQETAKKGNISEYKFSDFEIKNFNIMDKHKTVTLISKDGYVLVKCYVGKDGELIPAFVLEVIGDNKVKIYKYPTKTENKK